MPISTNRIVEYNAVLKKFCAENNITLINLHESVMNIKKNDKFFFGNLHLGDTFGLSFLVNRVLTSLLSYSNGRPRNAKEPATKISRVNKKQFNSSSKPIHASYPANKFQYTKKNHMLANSKPAFMQQLMQTHDYINHSISAQYSYSNRIKTSTNKYHPTSFEPVIDAMMMVLKEQNFILICYEALLAPKDTYFARLHS